jgi:hypothetical protein
MILGFECNDCGYAWADNKFWHACPNCGMDDLCEHIPCASSTCTGCPVCAAVFAAMPNPIPEAKAIAERFFPSVG